MRTFRSFQLSFEAFSVVRGGIQNQLEEAPRAEPEEGAKAWYAKEEK